MNILYLGEGEEAKEMLRFTVNLGGGIAICACGDASVMDEADVLGIEAQTIDEIYENVRLKKVKFDLVISYLYGKIIKPPLIEAPPLGCINFHPAPLPAYRGRAGCSFAILDHLNKWGCTAHYMDEGIDTGAIISVKEFDFDWREETAYSLKQKTFVVMRKLYKEILEKVRSNNRLQAFPQSHIKGKYISKKDMLKAMEIKSGDDVDAKIQAFWYPPHTGAYIEMDGKKYTLVNNVVMQQLVI